jgi:hypothetical protein
MPHLLLVDDDEDILSLLTAFFRKHGHLVSTAATGAQPILSFETASTTGSSPGAAIPVGPGGAIGAVGGAYGLYKGSKQGLPLEEQQTQKKIDGQLKTYFAAQGWIYREPVHTTGAG